MTWLARNTVGRGNGERGGRLSTRGRRLGRDAFEEWIWEQLRESPTIPVERLRQMDRDATRRSLTITCASTARGSRSGERSSTLSTGRRPVPCRLWEPRAPSSVGRSQTLRPWVVSAS